MSVRKKKFQQVQAGVKAVSIFFFVYLILRKNIYLILRDQISKEKIYLVKFKVKKFSKCQIFL